MFLAILVTLISCDAHLTRYSNDFYNLENSKGVNLPLVEPFYITSERSYDRWFMGVQSVAHLNKGCSMFDIQMISVDSSFILLTCSEDVVIKDGCGNYYFVISIKNESLSKGFSSKIKFESYLLENKIKYDWINVNDAWNSYADTGFLPWGDKIMLMKN